MMGRGWREPRGNGGVITAVDSPCLQARTDIFTPANGSVTRTTNVHSHACMYACMHVDIYTHITGRAWGETQYGKRACPWTLGDSKSIMLHTHFGIILLNNIKQTTNNCLFRFTWTLSNSFQLNTTLQVGEALFQTGPRWNLRWVCLIQHNQFYPLNDCQTSALCISL